MYAEKLEINPRQAAVFLGIVVFSLVIADSATLVAKYYLGDNPLLKDLIKLFDLSGEKNIPTLFSTVLLLLCSILLSTISIIRTHRRQMTYLWIILAIIFLFLTVDEFVGIHEHVARPVKKSLNLSGAFRFGWVIPYGVLVAVLATTYSRFILRIPPRPRRLMLIAAFVYITSALGFEMVEGRYLDVFGGTQRDLAFKILTTLEESLEMIGLVTFVYALMIYIENVQKGVAIQIGVTSAVCRQRSHGGRQSSRTGRDGAVSGCVSGGVKID